MTTFRKVAVAAAAAALLALPAAAQQSRTPRDFLVMAWNIDAILTMDPAQIGEVVTDEVITNVCDPLIFQNARDAAQLEPGLAERWEVSEDGKTFTFHLRRGLTHPSGNAVTAQDAAWSIQRVLWLGFGNAAQFTQWGITAEQVEQQVRALDDHTLQVTVPEPWPPSLFLHVFAGRQGAILDRRTIQPHVTQRADGTPDHGNTWLKTNAACIGPYRLAGWRANETVTLERNDNYWRGRPPMRRIVIRHVAESAAQRLQLERGDIDVARDLNGEDTAAVAGGASTRILSELRHELWYIGANLQHPVLSNREVRMAMRYLMDYQGLQATTMRFAGRAWNSFAPQGAFGALPQEEGLRYSLDLAKAREHLRASGVQLPIRVRLMHATGFPSGELAQHFQANAARVGIEVQIEQMAAAQLFSRMRDRNFDLAALSWSPGYPDADANASRHVFNPDNRPEARQTMFLSWRASYFDGDMNALVDRARLIRNEEERRQAYYAIQRRFMEEGPFFYAFQRTRNLAVGNQIADIAQNAFKVSYFSATKR
jgi:peptide/nickel transport system substrate-binding protein